MNIDRFFGVVFSPVAAALYALFFAAIVDIRTWRRIGESQYGLLQQLTSAVSTGGLVLATLDAVVQSNHRLQEPNLSGHLAASFLVVLFLCGKLTVLTNALAPPRKRKE